MSLISGIFGLRGDDEVRSYKSFSCIELYDNDINFGVIVFGHVLQQALTITMLFHFNSLNDRKLMLLEMELYVLSYKIRVFFVTPPHLLYVY